MTGKEFASSCETIVVYLDKYFGCLCLGMKRTPTRKDLVRPRTDLSQWGRRSCAEGPTTGPPQDPFRGTSAAAPGALPRCVVAAGRRARPTREEQLNRVALVLQWRDGSLAPVLRLVAPKAADRVCPGRACPTPEAGCVLPSRRTPLPASFRVCSQRPQCLPPPSPARVTPRHQFLPGSVYHPPRQDVGLCVGLWWRHCAAGANGVCGMPCGGAGCARGGSLDNGEEQGHPVSGGPARP